MYSRCNIRRLRAGLKLGEPKRLNVKHCDEVSPITPECRAQSCDHQLRHARTATLAFNSTESVGNTLPPTSTYALHHPISTHVISSSTICFPHLTSSQLLSSRPVPCHLTQCHPISAYYMNVANGFELHPALMLD
ncbi:hypothetical protein TcWFU_010463 [Taenia crassiceps]|uniref:Uncharacterized protein n=1 Tax=Taenia crassiceps TaxID=6207 RepID=A0ABR4Q6W9_9CEST